MPKQDTDYPEPNMIDLENLENEVSKLKHAALVEVARPMASRAERSEVGYGASYECRAPFDCEKSAVCLLSLGHLGTHANGGVEWGHGEPEPLPRAPDEITSLRSTLAQREQEIEGLWKDAEGWHKSADTLAKRLKQVEWENNDLATRLFDANPTLEQARLYCKALEGGRDQLRTALNKIAARVDKDSVLYQIAMDALGVTNGA